MDIHRLLLSFTGRISRVHWWIGFVICFVASLLGSAVIDPGVWTADPPRAPSRALALWDLVWVVPATAITVKRFNDRNRPWWPGYFVGAVGAGLVVAEQMGFLVDPDTAPLWHWGVLFAAIAVLLAALIDNGFMKGTDGANRYGPDPLAE